MLSKTDEQRLRKKMIQTIKEPCILCEKKASGVGQFIPDDPRPFMTKKKVWHYTIVKYLPSILRGGLKVAKKNVKNGEKPVVWFSTNQSWEETANKSYMKNDDLEVGDKDTTLIIGEGLIRIEVSPKSSPITWKQFKSLKHIKKRNAKMLESEEVLQGANPDEWRISFQKVPIKKFLSVEYFSSDLTGWIDVSTVLSTKTLEILKNNPDITGKNLIAHH